MPREDLVTTKRRAKTQKTRVLGGRQQMLRVDREARGPLSDEVTDRLAETAIAALDSADVLVFQDYDKGTITPALAGRLVAAAAEREIPSVVDPKLRHFFDFRGADLFKPNRRELAAALGIEEAGIDDLDLAVVLDRLGVANLLLTLGSEGMLLIGRDVDGAERIPSRAREVFDVTGAGDTVLAVMAVAIAAGRSLLEGARLATVAAGLQVSHAGAVPITAAELLAELDDGD
ncbi:MAG: PfkB family carbohydrate kinase [Thermoanaerobaculia bacterium]|nr:PfkB family carbohydrate kinase [Thermoanaerobaculia bacterium]